MLWSANPTGDGGQRKGLGVNDELTLFVGTYTDLGAEGIYTCRMNAATGAVECVDVQPGIENPTFLTVDPSGEHLYAASERMSGDGVVTAYAIGRNGTLTLLNSEHTGGAGPCHVQVDRTDAYVVVANYFGGSVCLLPIRGGWITGGANRLRAASRHVGPSGAPAAGPRALRDDRPRQCPGVRL